MDVLLVCLIALCIILIIVWLTSIDKSREIEKLKKELTAANKVIEDTKKALAHEQEKLEKLEKENQVPLVGGTNKILVQEQTFQPLKKLETVPLLDPDFQREYSYLHLFSGQEVKNFPDTYVCIDVETTGMSATSDHLIEVSAAKVKGGEMIDRFSSLVNPHDTLPENIVKLTGITDSDLEFAPEEEIAILGFMEFVGGEIVIGHNVSFDIGFLHESAKHCGYDFSPDFVDTLRLSRELLPNLPSKKLEAVCRALSINPSKSHRALDDAIATHECYLYLRRFAFDTYRSGHFRVKDYPPNLNANKNNPFYGKTIIFSGELKSMARCKAVEIVADLGGKPREKVLKSTNYIVVGDLGNVRGGNWSGKSAKVLEAERLILEEEAPIKIITESEFLEIIKNRPLNES